MGKANVWILVICFFFVFCLRVQSAASRLGDTTIYNLRENFYFFWKYS